MSYQSKWHKLICDGFRFLSFAAVLLTMVLAVVNMWADVPGEQNVMKMLMTAIVILIASGIVGIIFTEKTSKGDGATLKWRRFIRRAHSNARMSQIVTHGDTVYLAGQVATERRGQSVTAQTEEILAAVDRYLAEAGSDKTRILSATVWLSDMAAFDEFNRVWDAWVPAGDVPARACVEAKLVAPDFNVEVAVVAALKE